MSLLGATVLYDGILRRAKVLTYHKLRRERFSFSADLRLQADDISWTWWQTSNSEKIVGGPKTVSSFDCSN